MDMTKQERQFINLLLYHLRKDNTIMRRALVAISKGTRFMARITARQALDKISYRPKRHP